MRFVCTRTKYMISDRHRNNVRIGMKFGCRRSFTQDYNNTLRSTMTGRAARGRKVQEWPSLTIRTMVISIVYSKNGIKILRSREGRSRLPIRRSRRPITLCGSNGISGRSILLVAICDISVASVVYRTGRTFAAARGRVERRFSGGMRRWAKIVGPGDSTLAQKRKAFRDRSETAGEATEPRESAYVFDVLLPLALSAN